MNATETEILDRLQRIFREVLERNALEIGPETTQSQVPEWDSLAQVSLIMAIESEFGLRFSAREAGELLSVNRMMSLIRTKLVVL